MTIAYWNNLNERERWILGSGTLFCIIYLFYLLLYAPLTRAVHEKSHQLIEKQSTYAWMQQVREQYKTQKTQASLTSSQLLTVLAEQLNHSSFKQYPYHLQQTAVNDIQLAFDNVPYNAFMSWLWMINEKYLISIKQFNVEHTEVQGVVKLMMVVSVLTS